MLGKVQISERVIEISHDYLLMFSECLISLFHFFHVFGLVFVIHLCVSYLLSNNSINSPLMLTEAGVLEVLGIAVSILQTIRTFC